MCESNTCGNTQVEQFQSDGLTRRDFGKLAAGVIAGLTVGARPSNNHAEAAPEVSQRAVEIPENERENGFEKITVANGTLSITPRTAWATEDLAPKGELQTEEPKFLLVHHTAGSTNHTIDEVPGILESIYNLHTGPEKQKNDIFYNFMIDSAGNVYETRDGSIDGPVKADATGGNQGSSQLVCLIGDFTDVMPTEAAESSLVQTLAWLAERDGIDTASGAQVTFESEGSNKWPAGSNITTPTIAGHRDMSQTACPGDSFYGYLTTAIPEKVNNYRLEQIAKQNTTTLETTTTSEVVLNDNGFADPQEGTPENSTSENNAQDLATGNTTALGITVQNQENADSSPPSESGPISGGIIVGVGVVSVVTGIGIAGGLYSSSD